MEPLHERRVATPIGELTLIASDRGLRALLWDGQRPGVPTAGEAPDHQILNQAARELDAYFAGTSTTFDVPLDPTGTPFQQSVWSALIAIPFGETCSYATIARWIGRPSAVRAVGAANGRNPIPVIVPCHRVIGSDGSLTGFGGGLEVKRTLLALERPVLL